MLRLEGRMKITEATCYEPNLCDKFSVDDLHRIGDWCAEGYQRDYQSLEVWRRRSQAAMDLALQLQVAKSFPWPGCSNVAFPLVTIAAMEFHSRAYPTLLHGTDVVKMRVPGPDPQGKLKDRALRVGKFMSWQVKEQDEAWEEQTDRTLLQVPIVGCAFKKSVYSPEEGHNISTLVPAIKLVMDYAAKSVDKCGRKTHEIELYRNEVYERCKSGVFRNFLDEAWYKEPQAPRNSDQDLPGDNRTGRMPPEADESTPLRFQEQHCWMDADGDGYAEPYIITFEQNSREVARIVARWEDPADITRLPSRDILRIRATEQFTKYELIPSPDGSVYGIGFGVLLGPLNEAVNSLVNQLIDAGTISNTAGGFLSTSVKFRGGAYTFTPFGWNRVNSTGQDLKDGIFPIPVREPSQVLFTLLSFLVNYTQRISGSTDMLAGENPGQNTPATTSQEMVAQGMKIYSALFKRIWRCMKKEFEKLYQLNARNLPATMNFGDNGVVAREDFLGDPTQIAPVADPNVVSESLRIQAALAIADRAHAVPGYDIAETERNLHAAMGLEGSERLYPGPDKVPPLPNPKVQVEEMKMKVKMQELEQKKMEFAVQMQEEQRVNTANIIKLMAQAEALAAQAESEAKGHQIAMIEAMIGMAKLRNEQIQGHIDSILKVVELDNERRAIEKQPATAGGGD